MNLEFNKEIRLTLAPDVNEALSRSKKSLNDIVEHLAWIHPEITYSAEEWATLDQDTKNSIINRVRKTLLSI